MPAVFSSTRGIGIPSTAHTRLLHVHVCANSKTSRAPLASSSMRQRFWFRVMVHSHTMIACANNRAHVIAINRMDSMVAPRIPE